MYETSACGKYPYLAINLVTILLKLHMKRASEQILMQKRLYLWKEEYFTVRRITTTQEENNHKHISGSNLLTCSLTLLIKYCYIKI